MNCKCGFKFSKTGEFRNCEAFITTEGKGGIICPECNRHYVDGQEVVVRKANGDCAKGSDSSTD